MPPEVIGNKTITIRWSAYHLLLNFNKIHASVSYHFQFIVSYLSKVGVFNLPYLYLSPLCGVTLFEFLQDVWHQKNIESLHGPLCGTVCVILSLAILIQNWHVTDTQTDRHTHTHTARQTTTAYTILA